MKLKFVDIKDIYYPYDDFIKDYLLSEHADIKKYKSERKNQASPIVIKWEADKVDKQTFVYSLDSKYQNSIEVEIDKNEREVELYNLYKASTYHCKLVVISNNNEQIIETSFSTTDLGPRIMNVDGVFNVRDVGGYVGYNDKRTKQGLLYRGGALDISSDHHYDVFINLSEKGKQVLSKELKIKTEFDIRKKEEALFKTKSLIPNAELIYFPTNGYLSAFTQSEGYRDVFKALSNEKYYPIYMHCTGGADRTGTVCFILNALLGVKESDLIHDYEITTFSIYGIRDSKEVGTPLEFYAFYEYFKDHYQGDNLREKAINYLLDIGVTKEEIENIEKIMFWGTN